MKHKKRSNAYSDAKVVIIGGSIAGLCLAKSLSETYKEIIVIEKDKKPDQPTVRKSAPQMSQHHILLAKGRELLEDLFPGIDKELAQLDSPLLDYTQDAKIYTVYGECPRFKSDILVRPCSRILLEHLIRERVSKISNIKIHYNTQVVKLKLNSSKNLHSVSCKFPNGEVTQESADLFFDASGRNSQTPRFLKELGLSSPQERIVNPYVGYATRAYTIPDEVVKDFSIMEVASHAPNNPRAAGLWRVEKNKWLLALIGTSKEYPGATEKEYNDFASKLINPHIYNIIKQATPISDIKIYRGALNKWRQYHKLTDQPKNLLVVGDAFCNFNPLYGQGMSVVLLQVQAVTRLLQKETLLDDLGTKGQQLVAKVINDVWPLAASEDLRWSETTGDKASIADKLSFKYMDALMPLAPHSPLLIETFLKVANLQAPITDLISPKVFKEVLKHKIQGTVKKSQTRDGVAHAKY